MPPTITRLSCIHLTRYCLKKERHSNFFVDTALFFPSALCANLDNKTSLCFIRLCVVKEVAGSVSVPLTFAFDYSLASNQPLSLYYFVIKMVIQFVFLAKLLINLFLNVLIDGTEPAKW